MNKLFRGISLGVWMALLPGLGHAEIRKVRLTTFADAKDFSQLYPNVNAALGTSFTNADFSIGEQVPLKDMLFLHLLQMRAGQPVEDAALRLWIGADGAIIALEGYLDRPTNKSARSILNGSMAAYLRKSYLAKKENLDRQESLVRASMQGHADAVIADYEYEDRWKGDDFQRVFTAKGKRGFHELRYSHKAQAIVAHSYKPFHQVDELEPIPALAFKVYEQSYDSSNPELLPAEPVTLKYINAQTTTWSEDPFASVNSKTYSLLENAETLAQYGFPVELATWSFQALAASITQAQQALVKVANGFEGPHGLVLDGRYVNVTVHPDATAKLPEASASWLFADQFAGSQVTLPGGAPGVKVQTHRRSLTFKAPEALLVPPVRHPEHALAAYVNEGADQIQVYWAVTEMMEKLQQFGFTDPELSTKKFEAVLYNPDAQMANNAYYVADTINFTTYSPTAMNFARDNTTIWHELGHGIIDRLMGPALRLSKSAGFHEGASDFIAELMVQATSFQLDYPGRESQRIYNSSLFNLYNQSHDAGEAFGGFMKKLLDDAILQWGEEGVAKTADLLLEAMRFSRNHPRLDEQEWVEKLRFADGRGSSVREAGSFAALITDSLKGRNFSADGTNLADVQIEIDGRVLGDNTAENDTVFRYNVGTAKNFDIKFKVTDGSDFKFTYPVRMVVENAFGALFGIDWLGEDQTSKQEVVINASGEVAVLNTGFSAQCDFVIPGTTGCADVLSFKLYEPNSAKPVSVKTGRFGLVAVNPLIFRR